MFYKATGGDIFTSKDTRKLLVSTLIMYLFLLFKKKLHLFYVEPGIITSRSPSRVLSKPCCVSLDLLIKQT